MRYYVAFCDFGTYISKGDLSEDTIRKGLRERFGVGYVVCEEDYVGDVGSG